MLPNAWLGEARRNYVSDFEAGQHSGALGLMTEKFVQVQRDVFSRANQGRPR
jgi:hypothetical protein